MRFSGSGDLRGSRTVCVFCRGLHCESFSVVGNTFNIKKLLFSFASTILENRFYIVNFQFPNKVTKPIYWLQKGKTTLSVINNIFHV